MLSISLLITALTLVSPVFGHAEVSSPFANHPAELARRQVEMNKRHIMARDCASQVADYHRRRKVRRALRRRNGGHAAGHANIQGLGLGHGQQGGGRPGGQPNRPQGSQSRSGQAHATSASSSSSSSSSSESSSEAAVTSATDASTTDIATTSSILEDVTSDIVSSTSSAAAPHYSTIQNFTCVTAPEVTEGKPYYLRDEYVRGDIREDEVGTTLFLDIGVIDIRTCTPAEDVFVEIWSCSARGEYSAFGSGSTTGNSTTGAGGGAGGNGTMTGVPPTGASGSAGGPPTQTGSGAMPSGSGQPGGGGGGGGGSSSKANGDNFLRGGLPADSNGIVEMTTLYPGFYTGRTVHIHTMIHQNITYHTNGTIISASGSLRHIGQIFFDEALNAEVLAQEAYSGTGQSRTYNADDGILEQANTGGFSAFADVERLGDSLEDGLLAYITIGIDSGAEYNITTNNYWDPNFSASSTIAE